MFSPGIHIGSETLNPAMEEYVLTRRNDGIYIFNASRIWEQLYTAVNMINSVYDPRQVCAISTKPSSRRAVTKFADYIGSFCIVDDFIPGSFTNADEQSLPLIVIASDPATDHLAISEAVTRHIPVVAFCNTDSPIGNISHVIPCNNQLPDAIGAMWWLLTYRLATLRGKLSWDLLMDNFSITAENADEHDVFIDLSDIEE